MVKQKPIGWMLQSELLDLVRTYLKLLIPIDDSDSAEKSEEERKGESREQQCVRVNLGLIQWIETHDKLDGACGQNWWQIRKYQTEYLRVATGAEQEVLMAQADSIITKMIHSWENLSLGYTMSREGTGFTHNPLTDTQRSNIASRMKLVVFRACESSRFCCCQPNCSSICDVTLISELAARKDPQPMLLMPPHADTVDDYLFVNKRMGSNLPPVFATNSSGNFVPLQFNMAFIDDMLLFNENVENGFKLINPSTKLHKLRGCEEKFTPTPLSVIDHLGIDRTVESCRNSTSTQLFVGYCSQDERVQNSANSKICKQNGPLTAHQAECINIQLRLQFFGKPQFNLDHVQRAADEDVRYSGRVLQREHGRTLDKLIIQIGDIRMCLKKMAYWTTNWKLLKSELTNKDRARIRRQVYAVLCSIKCACKAGGNWSLLDAQQLRMCSHKSDEVLYTTCMCRLSHTPGDFWQKYTPDATLFYYHSWITGKPHPFTNSQMDIAAISPPNVPMTELIEL